MEELKPCPFCGSKKISLGAYDIAPECYAECKNCGVLIMSVVHWKNHETVKSHDKRCFKKMTKLWNRRANK